MVVLMSGICTVGKGQEKMYLSSFARAPWEASIKRHLAKQSACLQFGLRRPYTMMLPHHTTYNQHFGNAQHIKGFHAKILPSHCICSHHCCLGTQLHSHKTLSNKMHITYNMCMYIYNLYIYIYLCIHVYM